MAPPIVEPIIAQSSQLATVAASTGPAVLSGGGGGGAGDYLSHLLVVPTSLSPGSVTITDGSGSAVTVFAGGASSLLTLHPFPIPWGAESTTGPWKVTTGAGLSVVAFGRLA